MLITFNIRGNKQKKRDSVRKPKIRPKFNIDFFIDITTQT